MNVNRYIVDRMCSRKVRYGTKQAAKRAGKKINKARAAKGEEPMRIYRCPICGYWHFTHREKQHGETSMAQGQRTDKL